MGDSHRRFAVQGVLDSLDVEQTKNFGGVLHINAVPETCRSRRGQCVHCWSAIDKMLVHPRKSLDHKIMKSTLRHEGNTCIGSNIFFNHAPPLMS